MTKQMRLVRLDERGMSLRVDVSAWRDKTDRLASASMRHEGTVS